MSITEFMSDEHGRCDHLFAAAEQAVSEGDWEQAQSAHQRFIGETEKHFLHEETLLFPEFEQVSGQVQGPTVVMRHEHQQMRQLFAEMGTALGARDTDGYLGATETLLVMMQQHNAKEEQILYPMTDQLLGARRGELLDKIKDFEPT